MTHTTIRHFRLHEKLDESTSGPVYRAEDVRSGRTVALKFLPFELKEDPEARRRFTEEAQAASNLDHPNICTVYEIGEAEDGRMFAALAYYESETLKRKLERGPLPIEQAIDVARQMVAGLDEAHRHGLVHRDLVPANLLVSESGEVKILDFGLAKQVSEGGLTQIGWSFGTPEYMSPEQIRGADADAASDLWSLGIVLYEMITGRLPFTGPNLAGVLTAIQKHDPPPLGETRPEAPPELDAILRRLLAKDPAERYAACAELREDLGDRGGELRAPEGVKAPSTGSPTSSSENPNAGDPSSGDPDAADTPKPAGREWLWAAIALLVVVIVLWLLLANSADGALLVPRDYPGKAIDLALLALPALSGPAATYST